MTYNTTPTIAATYLIHHHTDLPQHTLYNTHYVEHYVEHTDSSIQGTTTSTTNLPKHR